MLHRTHTGTHARTVHRLHFIDSAGFSAVGRVCAATGSKSWGEAWSKSVGESTAWVPSALIGILTLSVSLQYTMVIGDSFSSIFSAWGLPSLIASRSGAIVFLTALGTLPLSLLPSLSALGFMTLKKKLVERGVPQADVNKAANKFALKEIASKYDCKITFVD